ncbi:hypothetical protein PTKIN_Ptkin10aG0179200 [Pterospermum kingtungense]
MCYMCLEVVQEREANARMAKGQSGVLDIQEEESSSVDSPNGEDSSLMWMNQWTWMWMLRWKVTQKASEPQERHEEEEDDNDEEEEEENDIKNINRDEVLRFQNCQESIMSVHYHENIPFLLIYLEQGLNTLQSSQHTDVSRIHKKDNKKHYCWRASALKIPKLLLTYEEFCFPTISGIYV